MAEEIEKERTPALTPENQFPKKAIEETKQKYPPPAEGFAGFDYMHYTWEIASAADEVIQWGRSTKIRDRQLRDFWPTETFIAGALASVCFRNATLNWEIRGPSERVCTAVTDMLRSAIGRTEIGWIPYEMAGCQDLYSQDNGRFEELIRDPGIDANSKFKGEKAPVIGIAHLDAGQCVRTGDPIYPIVYTDRNEKRHKLAWYNVICSSDFPSPIEKMNGVGICAVSRALRMAQIMRSIEIFKQEKIGGRYYKQIHMVSGVSRTDIEDAKARGQEEASNQGQLRYIDPMILASLDPEKPVTTATIDLAALPDGFDYDQEMQWYITALSLVWGVDYQEFAPLPSGNIGSGEQSLMLHKKTSGKGPATYMRRKSEAYKIYGVLPRGYELVYTDWNEQEELERQLVRTKAMEELAIAVNSKILTPAAARDEIVKRHLYDKTVIESIDESYGEDNELGQPVGDRGGNTIAEDAGRVNSGRTKEDNIGGRLKKFLGR